MSNPLVYSRNDDFTSLVDPPNQVQPATLTREIEDSACVAEVDFINTNEIGWPPTDVEVLIYFKTEPTTEDEAAVDAVVAAHQGIPTTGAYQGVGSGAESSNATTDYVDKIDVTAQPVQAGQYQLGVSCEVKLNSGIGSLPANVAVEAVVELNDVEVAFCQWPFSAYHDFMSMGVVTLKEGDTPNLKLRFRRVGVADTAYIRRARVWLIKIADGEETPV